MNLTKKIVSLAAAATLVAGAGAMAATPAVAKPKPKTKGITVISFDKALAPVVGGIVVVAPAKASGTQLSFPVSKVVGNGVEHKGAIKVGALEAKDPIIIINTETGGASITLDIVGLQRTEVFTIKNFKIRTDNKKQQVWQGFLHLTSNPLVAAAFNQQIGAEVFTPDMGLGQIRTTINK